MMKNRQTFSFSQLKMGPVRQKTLLLLMAGAALSLTRNPQQYFRILKAAHGEWQKISQRSLKTAIRKLYQSKLIDYKDNRDGTVTIILNERGKKYALRYNLDSIKIERPAKWDGLWRMVIFDIPETFKKGRDALANKLRQLGFYPMQKSVFVCPYNCKNEIDFLIEIFDLRPYVRFVTAKETDIDLDLKNKFKLP